MYVQRHMHSVIYHADGLEMREVPTLPLLSENQEPNTQGGQLVLLTKDPIFLWDYNRQQFQSHICTNTLLALSEF